MRILPSPLGPVQRLPRDLRLLFWSLFLWSFGYGLYNYVWPLFLRGLNANSGDVGLVFSIGFVAVAATMIPGGILANKYELRMLLIIGWALSLPVPLLYYYARTWTDVLPGIILFQISGFNLPAFNAYIAGVGSRDMTASSFGTIWASAPLGLVFSPAVGGALLNWFSIRDIFLLSFVLFAFSTVVLFWIQKQPPSPSDASRYKLEIPRSAPEVILLGFLAGAAVAFSLVSPFLPLFFQDVMSLNSVTIQVLGSVAAAGQTVFAVLLGRRADVRSRGRTMALGLVVSATGLAGMILTKSLGFALPLVFLFGSARASSYVAYSILATIRPGATRAGQYGFYLTVESLGFVVGSYLGGFLYAVNTVSGFALAVALVLVLAPIAAVTNFKAEEGEGTGAARERERIVVRK